MSEDWYTITFEVKTLKSYETVFFKMRNNQRAGLMMNAFNERNNSVYRNFEIDDYIIHPDDIVGNLNINDKIITTF